MAPQGWGGFKTTGEKSLFHTLKMHKCICRGAESAWLHMTTQDTLWAERRQQGLMQPLV